MSMTILPNIPEAQCIQVADDGPDGILLQYQRTAATTQCPNCHGLTVLRALSSHTPFYSLLFRKTPMTLITIQTMPIIVQDVIFSLRTIQPRNTATTGFT